MKWKPNGSPDAKVRFSDHDYHRLGATCHVPTVEGAKDIVIGFKRPEGTYSELYLTDKSGVLRATAI